MRPRRPGQFGYGRLVVPGQPTQEFRTVTCAHWPCTRVFEIPPRTDPASVGGLCWRCNRYICPECAATRMECLPIAEGLERDYVRSRKRIVI